MRTRTSFQKRQKEIARAEKQRDKAAKRLQRKLARQSGEPTGELEDANETPDADADAVSGPPSGAEPNV